MEGKVCDVLDHAVTATSWHSSLAGLALANLLLLQLKGLPGIEWREALRGRLVAALLCDRLANLTPADFVDLLWEFVPSDP